MAERVVLPGQWAFLVLGAIDFPTVDAAPGTTRTPWAESFSSPQMYVKSSTAERLVRFCTPHHWGKSIISAARRVRLCGREGLCNFYGADGLLLPGSTCCWAFCLSCS